MFDALVRLFITKHGLEYFSVQRLKFPLGQHEKLIIIVFGAGDSSDL